MIASQLITLKQIETLYGCCLDVSIYFINRQICLCVNSLVWESCLIVIKFKITAFLIIIKVYWYFYSLHTNVYLLLLISSSDTHISDHSQLSCTNHNKQTISTNHWRHPNDNGKFVEWKHQMSKSKWNAHHLRYGTRWHRHQFNLLSFGVSLINNNFGETYKIVYHCR